MISSATVKQLAFSAGFDLCGVTTPEVIPRARAAYKRWLAAGHHAEMAYLARDPERRTDPSCLMDEARSLIMLGLNYYRANSNRVPPGHGRVARYARGKDYHKVAVAKMKAFVRAVQEAADEAEQRRCRWLVDYGPVLERAYAEKAGLGYIGKNGMLINRDFGSWILLSEVVTALELEPDEPDPAAHGRCGDCRLCIDACPTGAILSPRRIDSARCFSYLTIERPSHVPDELANGMADQVFGCDICQEVCPYNAVAVPTSHIEFMPDSGVGEFLDLIGIVELQSREEFLRLTAGTALTRPKLEGLRRTAEILLRNRFNSQTDSPD